MSSLYKLALMNKLANKVMNASSKSAFNGGDVTKDIRAKNESGIVFYDSDDEDSVRITAPNECDTYTIRLPEERGNDNDVLRISNTDIGDDERPYVELEFAPAYDQSLNSDSNVTFNKVTATDLEIGGTYFTAQTSGSLLSYNNKVDTRLLSVVDPSDPTNATRYSLFDSSSIRFSTVTDGETITLDAGHICLGGYVYVKNSGVTIQLPALSLSIDTGYNAIVSNGNGFPAINNRYTVHICCDGANTFTIGNANSPSGYTFINRSLPYTSPSVFSVVKLTFIKAGDFNYHVIIESS